MFYSIEPTNKGHVAYKHGYCFHCGANRILTKQKFTYHLKIIGIKFFPVGISHLWFCNSCNKEPQQKYNSLSRILLGVLFFIIAYGLTLTARFQLGVTNILALVLIFSLSLYGLIKLVSNKQAKHDNPEEWEDVSEIHCEFCLQPLETRPNLHCSSCNLRVFLKNQR
ncbi:MAG: hypothetical protein HWD86_08195 [Kangiellaceae bacterium]|nr:hypothetical protein [Kangiellaceae bacterium]